MKTKINRLAIVSIFAVVSVAIVALVACMTISSNAYAKDKAETTYTIICTLDSTDVVGADAYYYLNDGTLVQNSKVVLEDGICKCEFKSLSESEKCGTIWADLTSYANYVDLLEGVEENSYDDENGTVAHVEGIIEHFDESDTLLIEPGDENSMGVLMTIDTTVMGKTENLMTLFAPRIYKNKEGASMIYQVEADGTLYAHDEFEPVTTNDVVYEIDARIKSVSSSAFSRWEIDYGDGEIKTYVAGDTVDLTIPQYTEARAYFGGDVPVPVPTPAEEEAATSAQTGDSTAALPLAILAATCAIALVASRKRA